MLTTRVSLISPKTVPWVLYADDTTLYKPITCETDLSDFQKDIDAIHNWFCANHLIAIYQQDQSHGHFYQEGPLSSHAALDEQPTHRKS